MEDLTTALEHIAHLIDLFGIAIVLYGFVLAAVGFLRAELGRFSGADPMVAALQVRIRLGNYILTGIEFMIASDIIGTVLTREIMDLAFVATLVVIRSAISFFLSREVHELKQQSG